MVSWPLPRQEGYRTPEPRGDERVNKVVATSRRGHFPTCLLSTPSTPSSRSDRGRCTLESWGYSPQLIPDCYSRRVVSAFFESSAFPRRTALQPGRPSR